MSIQENFNHLRPYLQKRVAHSLARGAGVRRDFDQELAKFFDLLEEALVSGDASWLDTLLQTWATARTQTDLEGDERNVTALLGQVIEITNETLRAELESDEAVDLLAALTPIYLHCMERMTALESESRIAYLAGQVESLETRLEKLDRTKSNFISVAAHEFKTPLTLVDGYAAMIGDMVPDENQQIHALVHGVHNGIRRLREIVDDMIDVSLIENGMMTLNFQPTWMNRLFKLLKAEFQDTLSARRQELAVLNFPGSDELIFADSERLYQAVRNILSNAVKYTPDGGRITIDGRLLQGFLEITVSDTGIGIAPQNLDIIFEKFGQLGDISLHSSGKTKFKGGGPGLGLAISRGIVEAHGGSLWVESPGYDEVNCPGSTFHILLPLRTQPSDPQLAKLFGMAELSAARSRANNGQQ